MKNIVPKSEKSARGGDAKSRYLTQEYLDAKKNENRLRIELDQIQNSLSWRITKPLRVLNSWAQRSGLPIVPLRLALSKILASLRSSGVKGTIRKILANISNGKALRLIWTRTDSILLDRGSNLQLSSFYPSDVSRPAVEYMVPRVLIVGEMSIPQCKKYRIVQKAELFSKIGVHTTVLSWTDQEQVRSALQTHPVVIFYRVPAVANVIALFGEAKRLGVHTFWEVDDLIFDPEGYLSNKNLGSLDPTLRKEVLAGMKLYREALMLSDEGIASTRTLARVMGETTGNHAYVVENALDGETLATARRIREKNKKRQRDATVTIVYGSGTKTHDIDFLAASDGIFNVLSQRDHVKLRIIGELGIEDRFERFGKRIERFPFTSFGEYLETIAQADISIAPLEDTIFNEAKSNIKYLEASILGLPSVCSAADAFRSAIVDGDNGYLARSPAEWEANLLSLIDDVELRQTMALKAEENILRDFSPSSIASLQVAPIINKTCKRTSGPTRILLANVFFSPQSFGGATVVAEEMAERLSKKPNTEVYVFTTWSHKGASDYGIVRYNAKGATVFAVKVPEIRTKYMDIQDESVGHVFGEVLEAIKPDIVHLHSIQTLGVGLAAQCVAMDIPYVITLHDAWWLCERQFMVTAKNKYCFQTRIDPEVCALCVPDKSFNAYRNDVLQISLLEAAGLVTPSTYFKNLHLQNGMREESIFVNKNGVNLPPKTFQRTSSQKLRFGYVGGATQIKGYDLVRDAFSELPSCDVELVMVDNTLNQGYSSVNGSGMNAANPVTIVPAYTQNTIDDFFSQIDVLLFPTQWKESFGLTVREALVRDVWVIASDAGGVVEDIVPGKNGDIIPISSEYSHLLKAMERVIGNRGMLANYSNPYKDRIQSFQNQADELYGYLSDVIKRHSKAPKESDNMLSPKLTLKNRFMEN